MLYYIEGKLVLKTKDCAVIDCGGTAYKLRSTTATLDALGDEGSDARLYTYLNIKTASDIFALYGFATLEERDIFEMLLGVSGIGAKTAVSLLSNISPSKLVLCVMSDDAAYLSKHTQGLGPKGAKRLILELKDKLKGYDITHLADEHTESGAALEAASALTSLGYSDEEARRAVSGAPEGASVEDIIKHGLKNLI